VAQTRAFTGGTGVPTVLTEITNARGRRLEQNWDQAAMLTFTVDGMDMSTTALVELQTDVVAYRWDETSPTGGEVEMFRGIVAHSADTVDEQSHSVTFTCYDYIKMLERRLVTTTVDYSAATIGQDDLVALLLNQATGTYSSSGVSLSPGAYLPLQVYFCAPDGTPRVQGAGVAQRNRTYLPSTLISQALDDLAKVQGGYDYDCLPMAGGAPDEFRVFWPQQGLTRAEPVLLYGSNVSSLTRTVTSSDYANYWRAVGNAANIDPAAPQLYSEVWDNNANNVSVVPVGLWMNADNAPDVSIQSTLDQQAAGDLAVSGQLVPSYSLSLTPGWWTHRAVNMGDVVPLVVNSGRLNVNTTIRVLGIAYDIGDDDTEDVTLTVGRPAVSLLDLVTQADNTVDALTRR
jgi:hypothetical protein